MNKNGALQDANPNGREPVKFQSAYMLRVLHGGDLWFNGNHVWIDDYYLEFRKRNWHFISVDSKQFQWQYVRSLVIDKHLFGATIKINIGGEEPFIVHGMSKKRADKIKQLSHDYVAKNTQRGVMETLANSLRNGSGGNNAQQSNRADELLKFKQLYDQGVISEEEFNNEKKRLLS
ncbi:hypothetical protein EZS27_011233 [termite gut metagenome]|uniref:SHOCT domain-containing protein n=1 Tax=termite gut metagenome TaxID=433724 RepID=A0A5J4S533_9ZZZZ